MSRCLRTTVQPEFAQTPGERLGDHDRAVPPARAAERDGQIAPTFALVRWQEGKQQGFEALQEQPIGRIRFHVRPHRGVAPVQRSQLVDVVGIGEEPDVEHDVGLAREPATVGERQDGQGQPALLGALEVPADQTPQVARRQLRGIDHQIGLFPQARHDPALVGDAVGDRTVEGERMAPAGFVEPAAQDLVLAVQEQELRLGRRPAAPGADPLEQVGRVEGARAAVDADGEVVIQPVARPHQAAKQRDRQIVDGLEAEILQAP